jgi:hypothetical protein
MYDFYFYFKLFFQFRATLQVGSVAKIGEVDKVKKILNYLIFKIIFLKLKNILHLCL